MTTPDSLSPEHMPSRIWARRAVTAAVAEQANDTSCDAGRAHEAFWTFRGMVTELFELGVSPEALVESVSCTAVEALGPEGIQVAAAVLFDAFFEPSSDVEEVA
jgi:hypothetical protein